MKRLVRGETMTHEEKIRLYQGYLDEAMERYEDTGNWWYDWTVDFWTHEIELLLEDMEKKVD